MNLSTIPYIYAAQEETASFSWAVTTFSTSMSKVWAGEPTLQNFTGSFINFFTYIDHYINHSDNTYIEEKRSVDYSANYTYFYNYTMDGSLDTIIDITVYRVDVDYGSSAQLIWMALKKGFYEIDLYRENFIYNYEYNESSHQTVDKEIKKYDLDTLELLDSWNVTEEINKTVSFSYGRSQQSINDRRIFNETFTKPLFLTFQIYETEKGDRIAWASTFSEFLVFKDKNGDGIYSVGEFDSTPTGPLNMHSSSEYAGSFIPTAYEQGLFMESQIHNETTTISFPSDKTVDQVVSGIEFTPPSLDGNDTVVWDINYRGFPLKVHIGTNDIPFEQHINPGSLYNDVLPSDYSYGFDYKIGGGKADLSLTLGLPALTDIDTYNILETENYGLSLPRYDYFISSFDIKEKNPRKVTMPAESFVFESNNQTVAEINLINPIKENYTLYDYPNIGDNISVESRGASINNLIIASNSLQVWEPEVLFLYTIEDLVSNIPGFTVVDELAHIHTENYPVWAGKKLVHDPTNTIYFKNITMPFRVAAAGIISGYDVGVIFGSLSLVVLFITIKRKKLKKK